ncbi:hypothetical protein Clacol_005625 [Clathrus columnatus]|uniref:Cytochrome b561 domain-containing protein n=1 Tax=Clathrus columnatus TaxID=1419009 RepID=A0AAV5ACI1_9AGAM|nr:hypothetical protein Clacol_005625 [Clathrus columnatus]
MFLSLYELQSTDVLPFGWMAIGFGTQMHGPPMVIMWGNSDGTITLSQRQAPPGSAPIPVASPPKVATAVPQLSSLTGSQPKVVFTIPGTANLTDLIWAFGTTKPKKPANSTLLKHTGAGTFTLDLTKTLPGDTNGTAGALPSSKSSTTTPFLPYQKLIIAHAVIVSLGFLIFLPIGVLLARLTRTYNNKWFKGHWILQFVLGERGNALSLFKKGKNLIREKAGPAIIAGCILGFVAVNVQGGGESHTSHKTIGRVLLGLYLGQCALGVFIHFIKIHFWRFNYRPPQNYIHVILGLTILGLSFYQARLGFTQEWVNSTGRPTVPNGVNITWIILLSIVAITYIVGLVYLPRQLRQEKELRKRARSTPSLKDNSSI